MMSVHLYFNVSASTSVVPTTAMMKLMIIGSSFIENPYASQT